MPRLPRIYFYCRNEEGNLQEDVISLAEGFRELGIPYHGSCDYWQESTRAGDFLIRRDPTVGPEDCDVVVVSYTWPHWIRMGTFDLVRRALPERLFAPGRRYTTVYMDSHDGYRTVSWEPEFRQFDVIYRSKFNHRLWHPENMRPWALALTNRVLSATTNAVPFLQRKSVILINFGASHPYPHGAREQAKRTFEPEIARYLPIDRRLDDLSVQPSDAYEALMWRQTGHRFSRAYYERLKQSQAVACFCGELIPASPFRNADRFLVGGNRAKLRRTFFEILDCFDPRPPRSVQWDSFRFWEALVAGCTAFNIDLDRYGVELPVMPEKERHYVGVDLERPRRVIERLLDDSESLERIALEGRGWALRNYSPAVIAKRFLESLGFDIEAHTAGADRTGSFATSDNG